MVEERGRGRVEVGRGKGGMEWEGGGVKGREILSKNLSGNKKRQIVLLGWDLYLDIIFSECM